MPRVLDNSDGFFRRVLPVSFKRQFMGTDRDNTLEDQFETELSEIFQWALAGLMRLLDQDRFTDCQETQELMLAYKRLNNPVLCFVEDNCVIDENASVGKAELFEEVIEMGTVYTPYAIPYENNLNVYLCKNLKQPVQEFWPKLKSYN